MLHCDSPRSRARADQFTECHSQHRAACCTGDLAGSLALFQQAASLNTGSLLAVKQVARGLLLLGKHGAAAEVYDEALRVHGGDWELWHGRGLAAAAGKDEHKCGRRACVCQFQRGGLRFGAQAAWMQRLRSGHHVR